MKELFLEETLNELKNKFFSFSQTCITAINLIVEHIENPDSSSIDLLEKLRIDLITEDIFPIHFIAQKISKKASITNFHHLSTFFLNAEFMKEIGIIFLKIHNHLKTLYHQNEIRNTVQELILLARYTKSIITKTVFGIIEQNIEIANEVIPEINETQIFYWDVIMKSFSEIEKKDNRLIEYLKINIISQCFFEINLLCKKITTITIQYYLYSNEIDLTPVTVDIE